MCVCVINCVSSLLQSQIRKCMSMSKKVEFAGIRCQVSGLWSQGEKVQSGAIVGETRVGVVFYLFGVFVITVKYVVSGTHGHLTRTSGGCVLVCMYWEFASF